jgi:NADPH:quinone reductase-like Zn-dependent oxidoreductase
MKNIAICGNKIRTSISDRNFVETIEMNGIPIFCGLLNTDNIYFDRHNSENRCKVLVKIEAFSCNYRDKSLILRMATQSQKILGKNSFYVVGSDFVGRVVEIGSEVTELKVGDRVIANNAYPESGVPNLPPGIPSNHGSREYQILHQAKLMKIPQEMPDEVASAFSIGGQTSYSIIRKLAPTRGCNFLVTAATSNTSLFVINALKKYDVNIYATTTSSFFAEKIKSLGVKEVIVIEPKPNSLIENSVMQKLVSEVGKFDCIFDPFFDIYLEQVVRLIAIGGKYITCGLYDQYFETIGQKSDFPSLDGGTIMTIAMLNNLQLIGNCIGTTEDLGNAVQDYIKGDLPVVVDSVFTDRQISAFFDRTYNAKDRFGKVVYKYN